MHLAIDASSGYAFARIDPGITAAAVAKLLTANVLPFFEKYDISLRAVSISNRKISAEAKRDHLRAVLNDHQVKQLLWNDDRRVSGFGERFLRAAKAEFVKSSLACKSHQSLEELRESFRVWRQAYNKQELQGYPNFGRSPSALITPKK